MARKLTFCKEELPGDKKSELIKFYAESQNPDGGKLYILRLDIDHIIEILIFDIFRIWWKYWA